MLTEELSWPTGNCFSKTRASPRSWDQVWSATSLSISRIAREASTCASFTNCSLTCAGLRGALFIGERFNHKLFLENKRRRPAQGTEAGRPFAQVKHVNIRAGRNAPRPGKTILNDARIYHWPIGCHDTWHPSTPFRNNSFEPH